eukprot:gene36327-44037_t
MTLEKVLEEFGKSPEAAEQLRDAQRVLGVDKPLELVRPGKTRWNSFIDAWRRLITLRTAIAGAGLVIKGEAWKSIVKALVLCGPFGVATNRLQGDDVDTTMLCDELDTLQQHLDHLAANDATMKPTAQKAIPIFKERLKNNFDNPLRKIHRLFRPDIDQERDMTDAERTEALELTHRYGKFHAQRHGWEWDEEKIENHVADFIKNKDRGNKKFNDYWRPKRITMIAFASFVISVGRCMVTEASVERSYSKEGRILTALRNSLKENTTNAQMTIAMNWKRLYCPEEIKARKAKAAAKAEKAKESGEKRQGCGRTRYMLNPGAKKAKPAAAAAAAAAAGLPG